MSTVQWLSVALVLGLHQRSIELFGGASGLRDENLLEAAVARPMNVHAYGGEDDLVVLAAAYAFGIARNHAFIDGNKRTAFAAATVFLEINGLTLNALPDDAADAMERLAAGDLSEAAFARWLAANVEPVGNGRPS